MVLYGITLAPLAEELCAASTDLLAPLYVDSDVFDGPADRSSGLTTLLLALGPERGYFHEP